MALKKVVQAVFELAGREIFDLECRVLPVERQDVPIEILDLVEIQQRVDDFATFLSALSSDCVKYEAYARKQKVNFLVERLEASKLTLHQNAVQIVGCQKVRVLCGKKHQTTSETAYSARIFNVDRRAAVDVHLNVAVISICTNLEESTREFEVAVLESIGHVLARLDSS